MTCNRDHTPMTRDDVSELLDRHRDALNRHDVEALVQLYAPDTVVTSPMFNTVRGRDALRETFATLFARWPDYRVQLDDPAFVHEGNRAAEFGSVVATHASELFGLHPTGERIEYQFVRLYTFGAGMIAAERRIYDLAGIVERLRKAQLERELGVAGDLQRLLLPRIEYSGAHFEAIGRCSPSRSIGGDFFEYVDSNAGTFGVALGDASGKGPAAALVAAMVQGIFTIEAGAGQSPAQTLARVNRAMCRRRLEPHFVTLTYGVLSPARRFSYSNAGHNPPILVTATDGVRRLASGGPILGVFEDARFDDETVQLHPGDSVVLFSDGVTDAVNPDGEPFGDDRLLACVSGCRDQSARGFLDALFEAVHAFADSAPQSDDITALVLRVR
jgi:serine phosphatase RsbU (regulator of sigma subunit)/ketosteroid isomerase-like protein